MGGPSSLCSSSIPWNLFESRNGPSCDEGKGWSRDVQVWHCSSACHSHRVEAGRMQEGARDFGRGGHQGGQGHWQIHHPRPLHAQDTKEASDQGRQEGGVWKSYDGESQASQDCGQGILCGSAQEEHLSLCPRSSNVHEWASHSFCR